jgi:microcystin-dependent protein
MSLPTYISFTAGTKAKASEVNANFTETFNVFDGGIDEDNFATLEGVVTWVVTGAEEAINISHSGTRSAIKITHSGIPAAGEAAFRVDSLTSGALLPRMTTAQRNSIANPSEGMEIWNTSLKRKEAYDGTNWVDGAGRTGQVVDHAGASVPTWGLQCDGSAVSRTTYAALFAAISTTWGVGNGSTTFNLPDFRRRATVGSGGTGTGTLGNAVGNTGGAETLPAHTHGPGNLNTDSGGGHNHGGAVASNGITFNPTADENDDSFANFIVMNGTDTGFTTDPGTVELGSHGHTISTDGAHSHNVTDGATASTGTGTHGVIQPSAVVLKVIVI